MTSPRGLARLDELSSFDAIIDVRSPAEFADDHIPGAMNCPVLDDEERARIGTIFVQDSPFEARKLGAALVSENIARHLRAHFQDKPRSWRPLIYCWRGGQRSGSFTMVLRQIGWDACQLAGGYKAYRSSVLKTLTELPERFGWRVVCGPTGSGKTRLLGALAEAGAQVLDLEALASHRGSVLGAIPGHPQPGQRAFDTAIVGALSHFDPSRVVYVESESRKIGRLQVPESLIQMIRTSPCLSVEASHQARIAYLLRDYAHLGGDKAALLECLASLAELHSRETLQRWRELAEAGRLEDLLGELLSRHYDPLYARSQKRNFARLSSAQTIRLDDLDPASLTSVARQLLE